MTQKKKTYETKMTDLDAKIKALKQQKKDLKKKHEVDDLKLKVKFQSEQIAQLTADNRELKAKLSDADMSTVAFDPTPKLEKQKGKLEVQAKELEEQRKKIEAQNQQIKELQSKLSAVDPQNLVAENEELNNRVDLMKEAIIELGAKYKFKGSQILNFIEGKVQENKK